ncbi:MAG: transposase, partial [Acidimicrobiales bacterium]
MQAWGVGLATAAGLAAGGVAVHQAAGRDEADIAHLGNEASQLALVVRQACLLGDVGRHGRTVLLDHDHPPLAALQRLRCHAARPVLRLRSPSPDLLFDALLPAEIKVLPGELARLDELLSDPKLLDLFSEHWRKVGAESHLRVVDRGRPTIAMATYLRVMVLKHRTGFGYETLMAAITDSLHLRRFCLIPLSAAVPDESTVRKLTRRIGAELTDDLVRSVVERAIADKRSRPRAMRVDSTVAGADIRYPTDAGLASDAVRVLARAGRQLAAAVPATTARVRDRSRAVGRRLRAMTRTLRRRTGAAKAEVQRLTEEAADQVKASVREADKLLAQAKASRSRPKGVSVAARTKAIAYLGEVITLSKRVTDQVAKRFAGEKITDRLVSLFDPDARPIRRGKLDHPNEFGYVTQFAEVTANTKRGARGILLPPKLEAGSTHENALLPATAAELKRLGIKLKEASFDAGFLRDKTEAVLKVSRCSSSARRSTPAPSALGAGSPPTGSGPKAASRTSSASTKP